VRSSGSPQGRIAIRWPTHGCASALPPWSGGTTGLAMARTPLPPCAGNSDPTRARPRPLARASIARGVRLQARAAIHNLLRCLDPGGGFRKTVRMFRAGGGRASSPTLERNAPRCPGSSRARPPCRGLPGPASVRPRPPESVFLASVNLRLLLSAPPGFFRMVSPGFPCYCPLSKPAAWGVPRRPRRGMRRPPGDPGRGSGPKTGEGFVARGARCLEMLAARTEGRRLVSTLRRLEEAQLADSGSSTAAEGICACLASRAGGPRP